MHPGTRRRRASAPARLVAPVLGALAAVLLVLVGPAVAGTATVAPAARGVTVRTTPPATSSPAARPLERSSDRAHDRAHDRAGRSAARHTARAATRHARGWRATAAGAPRPATAPVAAPRGPTHGSPDHHGPLPAAGLPAPHLLAGTPVATPVATALAHPHPAPRHAPAQGRAPPR